MTAQAATPMLRVALPARAENVAVVRHALAGVAAELGADPDLIDDIKTAASEAATNVVVHAYPESDEGPMEVAAATDGSRLDIFVRDRGVGIQPSPLASDEPSLRVGLSLIGALAQGLEIQGEEGEGTEVRITFYLDPAESRPPSLELSEPLGGDETLIAVGAADPGAAAIPKVLELMVARSDLDLNRLADVHLIADYLSTWSAQAALDGQQLQISISETGQSIEIRIGPLAPGAGDAMRERAEVPGLGNVLERLSDRVEVTVEETPHGTAEFLTLQIG